MAATGTSSSRSRGEQVARAVLVQLVSFFLAGEEFALEILRVQEIIRLVDITRVPNSPDFVEGVINLRGRIIPVISLRSRVGLPKAENDGRTRIVIVDIQGVTLGMIVDAVSEVLRVPADKIEPPPRLKRLEREYVRGIASLEKRLLLVLDLDYILSQSEQERVAGMGTAIEG